MNRQQRRAASAKNRPASGVQPLLEAALGHHRAGRFDDAERLYRRVLAAEPRHADSLHLLGVIACQAGRHEPAIDLIRRAIALNPAEASYHTNLGVALKGSGRLEEAAACYRQAIALRPELPDPHNSLGNLLAEQGAAEDAMTSYRRAISLRPAWPEAHYNLGITLKELERPAEAAACYRAAIAHRPDYQEAHYNLGNALRDQRLLDEAIASYRRAIALRPDFPDAHHNLALALLASGDLPQGWAEFEWRWHTTEFGRADRGFTQPQWRGEAASGKTLLIHAEQGFGDTIQFCRYASLVAARGVRVILEVQPPLARLLRGLPGIEQVVPRGETLPPFDLHVPMLSLPLAFRTTIDSIPGGAGYLHPDPASVAAWQARLAGIAGPRVGVVWAGKATNTADRRRSLPVERLTPLLGVPGIRFFNLQKDRPAASGLIDVMDEMEDFADTAALIANLDLVISVDTAVAHLAAALGKTVWLLDRFDACWRWLTGRRDSPWYPGLRIYRQSRPGDWDGVLVEVARDLGDVSARCHCEER